MTIDETIKEFTDWAKDKRNEQNFWLAQRNESDETSSLSYADCNSFARDAETSAEHYEQLAEWLTELKDTRIENKVLQTECDSLIKENGELLSKVSGGDVLRICQLEQQLDKAKELLSVAVKSFDKLKETVIPFHSIVCDYAMQFPNPYDACNSCPLGNARYKTCKWSFADEVMELIGE